VFGGILEDGSYSSELWALDLTRGTWALLADIVPSPLQPLSVTRSPADARKGASSSGTDKRDGIPYDPLIPTPRAGHRMFCIDGRNPIIACGRGREGRLGDLWMFVVAQGLWLPLSGADALPRTQCPAVAVLPPVRPAAGEVADGSAPARVFVFGGDLGPVDSAALHEVTIAALSPLLFSSAERLVSWEARTGRIGSR